MMRAPFQILAIPYRVIDGAPLYCVFCRSDGAQWQFIADGGEDDETPLAAARREILEECGVKADHVLPLKAMCYIPTDIFTDLHVYSWPADTYVVPEYAFAFECEERIRLSHEHTSSVWLTYEEARGRLKWDSNRTALYELHCRIRDSLT